MASKAIPKREIEWIINRLHVSETDASIRADIHMRLRGNPWIATPAGQRFEGRCVAYALKIHAANRGLYQRLTAGRL